MKKNKEPIRILNIVPNMRAAGIETFIMNVYRNIDREKVQFDFLVHNMKREFFDDEIEKLGGKIYRCTYKDDKDIFKYIKDLNMFFKKHKEYKIVHGHMQSMMPLYLLIAKINNIPVRIAHAHNGSYEKSIKGFILHVFSRFSKCFSTNNWACSEIAGKYLFGKKPFEVIYNGIDIKKFEFNEEVREQKRKELNIDDDIFVIGHIGRFELQKNHEFIIELFDRIFKVKSNVRLVLVGEGKLEKKIRDKIKKLNLENKVLFLGVRKDVSQLYQAMDVFVLPSLYEGLPVVGVEAQISGLPCFFSNNITREVKISKETFFEKINNRKIEIWEKMILEKINKNNDRKRKIFDDKFDIKRIVKEICELYYEYYEK